MGFADSGGGGLVLDGWWYPCRPTYSKRKKRVRLVLCCGDVNFSVQAYIPSGEDVSVGVLVSPGAVGGTVQYRASIVVAVREAYSPVGLRFRGTMIGRGVGLRYTRVITRLVFFGRLFVPVSYVFACLVLLTVTSGLGEKLA